MRSSGRPSANAVILLRLLRLLTHRLLRLCALGLRALRGGWSGLPFSLGWPYGQIATLRHIAAMRAAVEFGWCFANVGAGTGFGLAGESNAGLNGGCVFVLLQRPFYRRRQFVR